MENDKQKLVELVAGSFLAGAVIASIGWRSRIKRAGNVKILSKGFSLKLDLLSEALQRIQDADEDFDLEELSKWFDERKAFIDIIEDSM